VLLLALGAGACGDDDTTDTTDTADSTSDADSDTGLAGMVRNPPLDVSTITLPNVSADGEPMAMVAPDGELLLVYFGYTACPDVCPTTMSDITVALGDLPPELADRVTVAMGTVDPERDTAEVLTGYLDHFFDDGIALRTDDPDELQAATDAFGVQFDVADHEAGEAYDVAHTAVTYVVDDTGTVVVEWPFGFESEAMTADITTLLNEETA
jgi:protein SCO1/2